MTSLPRLLPTTHHPPLPLSGRCTCGRNRYLIHPPSLSPPQSTTPPPFRLTAASPLHPTLRVPLTWYHSTTYSFFPDETHAAIRRVYTPPSDPGRKRYFCGFCGTSLVYWTEEEDEEEAQDGDGTAGRAEWVDVAMGSLGREDLEGLEERGVFDLQSGRDEAARVAGEEKALPQQVQQDVVPEQGGNTWVSSVLHGSTRAGTVTSKSSRHVGADGSVRVEWEVWEWSEGRDDEDGEGKAEAQTAKRKIGEVDVEVKTGDGGADTEMRV